MWRSSLVPGVQGCCSFASKYWWWVHFVFNFFFEKLKIQGILIIYTPLLNSSWTPSPKPPSKVYLIFIFSLLSSISAAHTCMDAPSTGTSTTYHGLLKKTDSSLPHPISSNCQLSSERWGLVNPSSVPARMLSDLISCRSCVGNHSCWELKSSVAVISRHYSTAPLPTSGFYDLSASSSLSPGEETVQHGSH